MKKIISLVLILTLCFTLALSLASCGGAPEDAGAEIRVYLGEEIYDFDYSDYYANANQEAVMSLLFDPLFKLSDNGSLLKDGVASGYSIDRAKQTITIQLRETYWSDEQRVTAEQFIYAWRNVLLEPTNANPAAALLYDIKNAHEIKLGEKSIYELGAEAKTDEIVITYRDGADPERLLKNLASIATAPIRQDIYDNASGYWTKILNYAISNGPFKIEDVNYTTGSFTISRNIGYHQSTAVVDYRKQVTPSKLISFSAPGEKVYEVSYADLEAKTVFYMSDATLDDRKANKDNAKVADALSTYTYVFNTTKPLFAIKEVRQALSMAVDREKIISTITFGKAATGFLPATVVKSNNKTIRDKNDILSAVGDIAGADKLLKTVNFSGIDKSFTLTIDDSAESVAIAEIAKAAWGELGFNVTINKLGAKKANIVDFKNGETLEINDSALQCMIKEAAIGKRDFDVIGLDWQMYSKDAFVALTAFSGNFNGNGKRLGTDVGLNLNIGGWQSDSFDELIKAAYEAADKNTRDEKIVAAEKLLLEEAVVAPLVFNQNFAFISRELSNIKFDGFGNAILQKANQRNYREYLY